ncbi:MAG: hypothetical protein GY726_16100 [Proteobacteria bacterium]|nr:hypothetical protein [Pseudomonadota bacterium]
MMICLNRRSTWLVVSMK